MVTEWQREAQRALNRRDYRLAHELCLKTLAAEPRHADALFLLGMIAAEHRNFAKAIEVIDRALAIEPRKPEYLAHRGRCLLAVQRPREAFEELVRAFSLHETRPVVDRVFPFEEAPAAFARLASGAHFGKVCVRIG